MRVVLRELPHAREARRARPTPRCGAAASARGSGSADPCSCASRWRIRAGVARAVHRLEAHLVAVRRLDEEHVLAVVRPVPGRLPQRLVVDDRRLHLDVAGGEEHAAHVVGERVVERRALGQPERRARRPVVEREEAELLADLAVVALLRLLEARQVLVELLLREERRAVDPLHRLVLRVALPVGVRRGRAA